MDSEQLAAWFEERRSQLHEVARSIVGTRADADDVVQDAWLKAASAWDDAIRSPGAWMTTAVRHLALDHLRHRRVGERHVADDVSEVASVEDALAVRLEAAAAVRRIVAAVDRAEAAALLLQIVFDEDHATLARHAGKSPGAMRIALHRARRRVRESSASHLDRAVEQTFVICWQAIVERDAAPLRTLLSTPAREAGAMHASVAAPPVRVALTQVAGRYVLALRQEDRVMCVLPVGLLVDEEVAAVD